MEHPSGTMVRFDAWQDDLLRALSKIAREMVTPTNRAIKDMMAFGPRVTKFNKEEWTKLIRSQYGVDPTKEDPERFAKLMKVWAENNALLIRIFHIRQWIKSKMQRLKLYNPGEC